MTTRVRLAPSQNNIQEAFSPGRNVRLRMLPGYNRALKMTSSALKYWDIPDNPGTHSHSYSLLQWATNTLLAKFHIGQQLLLENSLFSHSSAS